MREEFLMCPRVQSLESAEKLAAEQLEPHLREHQALATNAFNLIAALLAQVPEAPINQLPKALHVANKLMLRLSNDLRSVQILASKGYPVQALTVAASVCEVAYTVAWIGGDEARAQTWLDHEIPTRTVQDLRTMIRHARTVLQSPDPEGDTKREYHVYEQLCWAKHANPLLEKRYGIEVSPEGVIISSGPDASEDAIRQAWFALEHSTRLIEIAAASFFNNHVQTYCPHETVDRLLAYMGFVRENLIKLRAEAITRWGSETEPSPGR
jgi:hypothetical protein